MFFKPSDPPKFAKLLRTQLSFLARPQIPQRQRAVTQARQCFHAMTDGLEHSPYLPLLPFVQRDVKTRFPGTLGLYLDFARSRLPFFEKDSFFKSLHRVRRDNPLDHDVVFFFDAETGMRQTKRELPVVSEK